MTHIHAARYVLPISSDPIENGAIAIDGEKIAAVGPFRDLREKFPDAGVTDHGAAALAKSFALGTTSALTILFVWGTRD